VTQLATTRLGAAGPARPQLAATQDRLVSRGATRPRHIDLPWQPSQAMQWLGGNLLGVAVLLFAWYKSSQSAAPQQLVEWAALGAFGVLIAGLANSVWLVRGGQAVRRRKQAVCDELWPLADVSTLAQPRTASDDQQSVEPLGDEPVSVQGEELVSLPNMRYFHQAGCDLVAGKAADPDTRRVMVRGGKQPCGVCRP
jgi:hypothetical protein